MNFFEHQDRARGTTQKLVLLFLLAVTSLILITVLLVFFIITFGSIANGASFGGHLRAHPDWAAGISLVVMAVVLCGALFRKAQLSGGGRAVAESLGGRLINTSTQDPDERKILNVVEEMAIASGLPVPLVYVLQDDAINAFAAGYRKEDAVIGITRGCIRQLDRDELQGVIAHEFSHIFNGDMRLNIRLMAWLYGIMVIGMIGYFLLRSFHFRGSGRRGNDKGGALIFLALGLVVIGYGGTFFGNLIKAAVSRQREFLADASAVQFTRNPDGIAGALKKIAASNHGSLLAGAEAAEISHMLFGQGVKAGFSGMMATHPPLNERIKRIQPHWDPRQEIQAVNKGTSAKPDVQDAGRERLGGVGGAMSGIAMAERIVAAVGEPTETSLREARRQLAALPDKLKDELHNSLGACLFVLALLLAASEVEVRQRQLEQLQRHLNDATMQMLHSLLEEVQKLPRQLHLVGLELAMPSLQQLSSAQSRTFLALVKVLVESDGQTSLYEWCIASMVRKQLEPEANSQVKLLDMDACHEAFALLLNALVQAGQETAAEQQAALAAGIAALQTDQAPAWRSAPVTMQELDQALQILVRLKPLQKPRLLKAMVACILHDGVLLPHEMELLRATGALLDCPLPPLALD